MRKDIIELYEPFYQYTKQPSDSPEWRELRDLVDELIEKIDRPKGKWIGIGYDGYADGNPVYDEWECSNCGHEIRTEDTPPYCEMCGAEMEREE